MRRILCVITLLLIAAISEASTTTTLEISGDTLILSYPDSRKPVIFRREGGAGTQVLPMKIDIPGTWTLDSQPKTDPPKPSAPSPKPPADTPSISHNAMWPGVAGVNYSYTLRASGAKSVKWSASGLPKGLKCSQSGKISGRPSEAGTFSVDVTAQTRNGKSSQTFTLKIFADAEPKIVTETLTEAFVNEPYNFALKMNDSPSSVIMAGGVPEGLTMDGRGRISGKPAKPGLFTINITAANDAGESSSSLTLKVSSRDIPKPVPKPAPKPAPKPRSSLRILTSQLKQAFTGEEYSSILKTSSSSPVTWKSGTLPEGLTLNPETGEISGIPAKDFKGKITFTASSSEGSASRSLSFSVKTKKPRILTSLLPEGFRGIDYRTELQAEGGQGITWEFRGKIPEGLSFSREGVLEGIPEKAGKFSLNASAVNSGGKASRRFSLRVSEAAKLDYVTAAVMPPVTVSADGRYDFPVSIDVSVPAGSYIVWHSFPYGIEADGESYTFTDSEGRETITVPSNHSVKVSAWLEGGVRYEPVITARVKESLPETKSTSTGVEVSGEVQGTYSGCNASGIAGVVILVFITTKRGRKNHEGSKNSETV